MTLYSVLVEISTGCNQEAEAWKKWFLSKINIETRRSTTPGKRVILVQGPC